MTERTATGPPLTMDGRTVLITGAAGDIGRATAVRLAAAGCRVVIADVVDGLDGTAAACIAADAKSAPVPAVVRRVG